MKTPPTHSVLLVEDNPGFRFLFKEALESHGFLVHEAEDGEKGVELALSAHPELILLDLLLPKLHGFEVLKKIKDNSLSRRIPVVILSVLDEPSHREKCAQLGAEDYIVKGEESPQEIVKKVTRLLAKA